MRESLELCSDRAGNLGVPVAKVHHAEPAGKIDELAAIDVPQSRSLGPRHEERQSGRDAARDSPVPTIDELASSGSCRLHGKTPRRQRLPVFSARHQGTLGAGSPIGRLRVIAARHTVWRKATEPL
jgi:hypothetical protein